MASSGKFGGHVRRRRILRKQDESAGESIREIQCFLVGKAGLSQRYVRIREVVVHGEAKIFQVCGHVSLGAGVGSIIIGNVVGGYAQVTRAVKVSSSRTPGCVIIEPMRKRALGHPL